MKKNLDYYGLFKPNSNWHKFILTMKISAFLLFCCLVNIIAAPTYSQSTKISLNLKDATIEEILNKIEDVSEFYFLYNQKLIDVHQKVDIEADKIPIKDILDEILGKDIKYLVYNRQIILNPKNSSDNIAFLQQKAISGTITDASTKEPMPGVTVLVKGTPIGTVSDAGGKYTLTGAIPNDAILVFSFIGFDTKEVYVTGKSVIDMALEASLTNLDEVVVIGYGTAKRSDLVGSTSSISARDVINQPAIRVDQVLQGRSPGISVQNNSAAPDGKFTIRIRGSNSLQGNNDPLVVVDGFIGGDLSTINPNDISNIEILKDASSTAIYGSRGANGVIMVTTKRGTKNKTVVEYNNFISFQSISRKIDLLNAAEYAETVNANRLETGGQQVFTAQQIADFKANGGTDWQDVVFRRSIQQSHQVSVSGGTDKNIFYLSGTYANNDGIMKGSSFNQYSIRSNIESNIGTKFKVGLNAFLSKSENHPTFTGAGDQDQSPTQGALIWSPTLPVYNSEGVYTRPNAAFGPKSVSNPLAMAIEPINDNIGMRGELNSFLNYDIIKGLSAKVLFGARLIDNENSRYLNTKPNGNIGDASASITNNRFFLIQNTNQINYQTVLAEVHDISLTGAFEQQREVFNQSTASSNSFSSDVTTYNNLGLGAKPQIPSSSNTRKDILSYVVRANYGFKDKYLASLTTRYDGASVFGDQKWGFFPSAALAWRISSESFMEQLSAISSLKLRTSYGITGSQAVEPYASLATLRTNKPYAIGNEVGTGFGLGTIANPELRWEKTAQFNIGIDLGLFKGRVVLNVDYYNKLTSDLLMSVPMPMISGYTSTLRNIGSVENKGFEFNLSADPLNKEFKWNTNLNFAINKNKVIALAGQNELAVGGTGFPDMGNTVYLIVGEPIGILKGYIQDGTWGTAEEAAATGFETIPGAPKYIDQNKDGKITTDDIANMGSTLPKFTYGFSNNFSYKNFDLNIFLQGSQGNKVFNLTRIRSERSSSDADAGSKRILDRWTPENQDTDVPSFTGSRGYEQLQSSRWLEDGSYLRIKNITLGYNLPTDLVTMVKVSSARIFVSGVNMFTFTNYTGYDPEASTNVGVMGGIDSAPYPSQKSITAGINIKF